MSDAVRGDPGTVEDGPEYDLDFRAHPERYVPTDDEVYQRARERHRERYG